MSILRSQETTQSQHDNTEIYSVCHMCERNVQRLVQDMQNDEEQALGYLPKWFHQVIDACAEDNFIGFCVGMIIFSLLVLMIAVSVTLIFWATK